MKEKQQLSETLSETKSDNKPLYNAIIFYGHIYELITDFKEQRPCEVCEIQAFCNQSEYGPGICAIFDGVWNQYFKRRKD